MGNLVRHSWDHLLNKCDQKMFGAFKSQKMDDDVLVFKPEGIKIPRKSVRRISASYGKPESKSSHLISLVAPYPCKECHYQAELVIEYTGRRQGGYESHREERKVYSGLIKKLYGEDFNEISQEDKSLIYSQIVPVINNDRYRFVNAGMVYTIKEFDTANASMTIRLQNGKTYLLEATETDSITKVINTHAELSKLIRAYGANTINDNVADGRVIIIENIVPLYYEVVPNSVNGIALDKTFIKIDQIKDDVEIVISGGQTLTNWDKAEWNKFSLAKGNVDGSANSGNFNLSFEDVEGVFNFVPIGGSITDKMNSAVNLLSNWNIDDSLPVPTDIILGGFYNDNELEVVSVNGYIKDIYSDGAWGDIVEHPTRHRWETGGSFYMAQKFPITPEMAYTNKVFETPNPTDRYFMLTIEFEVENYDNVNMNDVQNKVSTVSFYINENAMPKTYGDSTKNYWLLADENKMSDDVPTGADLNIVKLIDEVLGYEITDDMLK